MAAATVVSVPSAAGATPAATTFPARTAVLLPSLPAPLTAPVDDRLDGYGFAGTVLGAATAREVDGQTAGPGQRLWVVGLRWQVTPLSPPAVVSMSVVADGHATPLPLPPGAASSPDTGPRYWTVSEPATAADVTVQASSGGFTQAFSLSRLRRIGTDAPALYRTPGQWQSVVPVARTVSRPIPAFDGGPAGRLVIDLRTVTVSEFGPNGPSDTPPAGAGAWLDLSISSRNPYDSVYFYTALTAGQITLTLPGRPPIDATIIPGGGLDTSPGPETSSNVGVFPDRYAFPVPAGITTATLTLSPTNITVGDLVTPMTTINLSPATFTLTIPPATIPPVSAGAASRPRTYDTVGLASSLPGRDATRPSATRSSAATTADSGVWAALGIAAIVAAAIAYGTLRSRRAAVAGPAWATIPSSAPPSTGQAPAGPPAWSPPRPPPGGWPTDQPGPPPTTPPETAHQTVDEEQPPENQPPPSPAVHEPEPAVVASGPARPIVAVMGPVTIEGWAGEAPRRIAVVELVVFLACHPDRPVSADRLRAALSGPAGDITDDTLRTYVSHARRALGADHVPPASDRGYRLDGVDCDWVHFQRLVAQADRASPDQSRSLLDQAVGLARGRAFPDGSRWADLEGLPPVIDHAVVATASRLADAHLDAGDPERAGHTASIGLEIAPTDEALAAALLHAGAATGHLTTAWARIAAGWTDADLPLPATLTQLRRRLADPT